MRALFAFALLIGVVRQSDGLVGSAPVLAEHIWRPCAEAHKRRVFNLLKEGFVKEESVRKEQKLDGFLEDGFRRLDERHAVFNFLHDYYNVRGAKGTRRLGRWAPGRALVTLQGASEADLDNAILSRVGCHIHSGGVTYDAEKHFRSAEPSAATPFMWYHSLLASTAEAEPILHCYNLHEWAMQYWPDGAPPPPSQRYQADTMPLRVTQETINALIERKGVRCTHVDALRFFAPAAGPLNHHGDCLEREDQLRLEQPGCVHAHMDLLKISARLVPWLASELVADALELALEARRLDVAASPYNASVFGIDAIPVETDAGRLTFRRRQEALMARAAPLRATLLREYESFLRGAFGEERLAKAEPAAERYARAEPGGAPWRRSLIQTEAFDTTPS